MLLSLNGFSETYINNDINKNAIFRNTEIDNENTGHKWTLGAFLRHLKAKNVDTECKY